MSNGNDMTPDGAISEGHTLRKEREEECRNILAYLPLGCRLESYSDTEYDKLFNKTLGIKHLRESSIHDIEAVKKYYGLLMDVEMPEFIIEYRADSLNHLMVKFKGLVNSLIENF